MRKRGRETYENCWALSIPGLFVRELGDGLDVMRMAWPTTDAAADRRGLGNTRMRYGDGLCFFSSFVDSIDYYLSSSLREEGTRHVILGLDTPADRPVDVGMEYDLLTA